MWRLLLLIVPLCIASCSQGVDTAHQANAELFDTLDREIENSREYQLDKERQISTLRNELYSEQSPVNQFRIVNRLIDEYDSYQSDSALHYVNLNLANPCVRPNSADYYTLVIRKADIASHAGLFGDAHSLLGSLPVSQLTSQQLEKYYAAYCGLYQYQLEYANDDSEFARHNQTMLQLYTDSVIAVTTPGAFNNIIHWAPDQVRKGNPTAGVHLLLQYIDRYHPGQRQYSIIASILAFMYKNMGDTDAYEKYIVLSAISDIRGVVKENMACRELATAMFERDDIKRANRYLKQSFADANFFAARMRNAQSSRMLPVIDEAYNSQQESMQQRLRTYILCISILIVALSVAMIFVVKQMRRVKRSNQAQAQSNKELTEMSHQMALLNSELSTTNTQLKNSNLIKEQYAGLFMEYCSVSISNLQQYHQTLQNQAVKGNVKTLLKTLESSDVVDKTLREFYTIFDEAILTIYPDFVDKFNELLSPGQAIMLKTGEKLNTELRIYALIRIGINDNEKIARFLRCSLSTIYTYRSKTKKRALNPADFERQVMNI